MSTEKDKNRYRNKERKVRFTEEENQYLLKKIRQSGLNNFQNYALKMLLNGQIVTIDYSELLNLRKEINKIGQNINQLTKYANTFNELDKELLLGLADEIDKMKKLVKEEFENNHRVIIIISSNLELPE